jgi:hypothetical protein
MTAAVPRSSPFAYGQSFFASFFSKKEALAFTSR